jgi:hypothetical protein
MSLCTAAMVNTEVKIWHCDYKQEMPTESQWEKKHVTLVVGAW